MKTIKYILYIGFLLLIVFCLYARHVNNNALNEVISIVGSVASSIGFIIVLIQLHAVRSATAAASAATIIAQDKMLAFLCTADLSKYIKIVQEAQSHCRNNKLELAILRIQDLKYAMHLILNNQQIAHYVDSAQTSGHILQLGLLLNSLEKQNRIPSHDFDISLLITDLEDVLNSLMALDTRVKQSGAHDG